MGNFPVKIKKLQKIVPELRMSSHHKTGFTMIREPTLTDILSFNYTAAVYQSGSRGGSVLRMLGNIIIDFDGGDKKQFKKLLKKLRAKGLAYLALPSPSHKNKLADGEYRMRVLVRAKNLTPTLYKYQFLSLLQDIGWNIDEDAGVDGSAKDASRFFYPPVMTKNSIKEPKYKDVSTGKWKTTGKPKPRNITLEYARKRVSFNYGTPYIAKHYYKPNEKEFLVPKRVKESGKEYQSGTDKEIIRFDGSKIIHTNSGDMTFRELYDTCITDKVQIRCDCPFHPEEHSDGLGRDYAWCNSEGHLLCAVNGSRHEDLIGFLDTSDYFDNEVKEW